MTYQSYSDQIKNLSEQATKLKRIAQMELGKDNPDKTLLATLRRGWQEMENRVVHLSVIRNKKVRDGEISE